MSGKNALSKFVSHHNIMVETGSCFGATISAALELGYKEVRSVELHPDWYQECLKKFAANPKVKLFQGRSSDKLAEMITDVNESVVFWLDAHPAGPQTAGHRELMLGDSSFTMTSIILAKLAVIEQHAVREHTILIDDALDCSMNVSAIAAQLMKINRNYRITRLDCTDEPNGTGKVLCASLYTTA